MTSGTVTSISGYSDLGGQDSAVTLGLWETAPNQNMATRANVIAGTMFHEIGHTLGLTHGGRYYDTPGSYVPTYEANCKPNFQSTMNYLFQLDGVGPNASVAFSNQTLATLLPGSLGSVSQLTDGIQQSRHVPDFGLVHVHAPWQWGERGHDGIVTALRSPAIRDIASMRRLHPSRRRMRGRLGRTSPSTASRMMMACSEIDGMPYTQLRGYNDVTNVDLRQVGATGGEYASLAS